MAGYSIMYALNFVLFEAVAEAAYKKAGEAQDGVVLYRFEDCLEIFRFFFECYNATFGIDHPPLKENQVESIIQRMPVINTVYSAIEIPHEDYFDLINLYFSTDYQDCNYRINHFFSGRIRELLFYQLEKLDDEARRRLLMLPPI